MRAYEIYLEDWLHAERELSRPVPQEGESADEKKTDQ
jgi:hypothetical protein